MFEGLFQPMHLLVIVGIALLVFGPKADKRVWLVRSCRACSTSSARRLVAPMTFAGFTALSVETSTKVSTPVSSAASAVYHVLITLL